MAIRSESAANAPEQRSTESGNCTDNSGGCADNSSRLDKRQLNKRSAFRRRLRTLAAAGAVALMLATSPGCSLLNNAYKQLRKSEHLDEFMISHRNKVFAARAWHRIRHCYKDRANLGEFKAGFFAGYNDVANGSDGCLPCVAPSQYWGWKYQSPGGQAAIDAWFAGYPLGVKAAEQDGIGYWGRPPVMARHTEPAGASQQQPAAAQGEMIYAPDGTPITDEIIVPGSTRIIESSEPISPLDMEQLQPPAVEQVLPLPEGDGSPLPGVLDEASFEMPSQSSAPVVTAAAAMETNAGEIAAAADLVPRKSATHFSLNDQDQASGETEADSIEGIFGVIEMPLQSDSAAPGSQASITLPTANVEPASETVESDQQGIPFKFE